MRLRRARKIKLRFAKLTPDNGPRKLAKTARASALQIQPRSQSKHQQSMTGFNNNRFLAHMLTFFTLAGGPAIATGSPGAAPAHTLGP